VIVCRVDPGAPVLGSGAWWDLGVPEVSGDADVARLAAQHRRGASRQRFYG
jgi:TPP-dependent trihydroxycyclohexane-1,2-dione (THcHDO) dehydratase